MRRLTKRSPAAARPIPATAPTMTLAGGPSHLRSNAYFTNKPAATKRTTAPTHVIHSLPSFSSSLAQRSRSMLGRNGFGCSWARSFLPGCGVTVSGAAGSSSISGASSSARAGGSGACCGEGFDGAAAVWARVTRRFSRSSRAEGSAAAWGPGRGTLSRGRAGDLSMRLIFCAR